MNYVVSGNGIIKILVNTKTVRGSPRLVLNIKAGNTMKGYMIFNPSLNDYDRDYSTNASTLDYFKTDSSTNNNQFGLVIFF
jgi:hypothetical protein